MRFWPLAKTLTRRFFPEENTMIDRARFFAAARVSLFAGTLNQGQVNGIEAILDEWEHRQLTDLRHLAYMLATPYHEVDRTMQPIKEYGGERYFFRMYDITGDRPGVAKHLGNLQPGDVRASVAAVWSSSPAARTTRA
jgi:putative chitinase